MSQAKGSLFVSNSNPRMASKWILILLSYSPHRKVMRYAIQLYSFSNKKSMTAPVWRITNTTFIMHDFFEPILSTMIPMPIAPKISPTPNETMASIDK